MKAISGPALGRAFVPQPSCGATQGPNAAETRIIEANVDFYLQIAEKYDSYETYLFDPDLQQSLEDDLDMIGSHFSSLGRTPSCLECGGGTGNLTLKMCARGWAVTVVDVSEKMLGLLQKKARAQGYSPNLIQGPIERFLEKASEPYDLVAFSSVLHHLYSYLCTVERASKQLSLGGIFYSNYDPLAPKRPFWARAFDSLDTTIAKVLFDPADVLPGIRRRLRKFVSRSDPEFGRAVASAGDVAEFHARTGVDDMQILQALQGNGFSIIKHQRFATGRTAVARFLNERLRLLESFKIIAQRNS
jgi:2-polyprenyl-3-methyl-5-hydroxy-6-metoxy-1,4-benzoquinol methylase